MERNGVQRPEALQLWEGSLRLCGLAPRESALGG
jgi:hypothetical protein